MPYPPNVERWRSLVAKYFRPEDVDKALFVIQHESGGNPSIKASVPSEQSWGLFQANIGGGLGSGSTVQQLQDPEYNIKLAAQAVYGGSGWSPWGEGATYQGQKFGALGNNPYPSSGGRGMQAPPPPSGGPPVTSSFEDQILQLAGIGGTTGNSAPTLRRDANGNAYEWDGTTWQRAMQWDQPQGAGAAPSAPSIRTDGQGNAFSWNGTAWVRETTFDNPASAAKPQGAVTTQQLQQAGAQMTTPGVATLSGQRYVQAPDGTWAPSGTPAAAAETKKTGFEQAAEALTRGQAILGQGVAGTAGSPAPGSAAPAPMGAPGALPPPTAPASIETIRGPDSALGQPGEVVGLNLPSPGGGLSEFKLGGQAEDTLRSAGLLATGNREQDLETALGAQAQRSRLLAEYKDPLVVQSIFDTINRGSNVYDRARSLGAEETAQRALNAGKKLPGNNMTAADFRDYLEPLPSFAAGGSVMAGYDDTREQPASNLLPIGVKENDWQGNPVYPEQDRQGRAANLYASGQNRDGSPFRWPQPPDSFNVISSSQQFEDELTNRLRAAQRDRLRRQGRFDEADRIQFQRSWWGGAAPAAAPAPAPAAPPASMPPNLAAILRTLGVPGAAEGANFVTDEEIIGIGARTGAPKFVAGESPVPGGPPTPELITVTPQQPPMTPFATLLETLMAPARGKGRTPPLKPVGAAMGGY